MPVRTAVSVTTWMAAALADLAGQEEHVRKVIFCFDCSERVPSSRGLQWLWILKRGQVLLKPELSPSWIRLCSFSPAVLPQVRALDILF